MNYYEDGDVIERIKRNITGKKLNRYINVIVYSWLLVFILFLIEFTIYGIKGKFCLFVEEVTYIDYIIFITVLITFFIFAKLDKVSTFYNFDRIGKMESNEQVSKRLKHNLYKYCLSHEVEDDYEINKDYIQGDDFYIRLSDGVIYKVVKTLLYEYKEENPKYTVTVGSIAV